MIFGINSCRMLLTFISFVAYVGLKDQFLKDLASRQLQEEK